MGPSGCGKSTLLHTVGGLITPSDGEMSVDGVDLAALSDSELARFRRDHLGFVFQFYNLIPTLDAVENIGLPLLLSGDRLEAHLDRLLDLARALVMRPAIILADEPTGNLDFVNGREVLQLLWESCVNFGQTTLMVTHDIRAARYADRVYFMNDGRLVDELDLGRQEDHTDVGPILSRLQEHQL